VIIYKGKCNLQIKEVFILRTENNRAYISGGLNAGDVIISKNQVLFYNAILENQ
jgi:cobalt-zinc-cadmium efflux system membrane fusion protein